MTAEEETPAMVVIYEIKKDGRPFEQAQKMAHHALSLLALGKGMEIDGLITFSETGEFWRWGASVKESVYAASIPDAQDVTVMGEEWENELTAKQRAFVREYLIDLNATQAAIRAGYSEKTAYSIGEENLRKPEIASAIEAAMKNRAERTDITADRVLRELAKIGFADIRRAIKWQGTLVTEEDNPDGGDVAVIKNVVTNNVQLISSDDIDDETAAAISEISQNQGGGIKLKLHDKRAALVDIGKHLGMFKEDNKGVAPVTIIIQGKDAEIL